MILGLRHPKSQLYQ